MSSVLTSLAWTLSERVTSSKAVIDLSFATLAASASAAVVSTPTVSVNSSGAVLISAEPVTAIDRGAGGVVDVT
jgi:DNA-binding transcriptional regulator YdaS (Cro superfamily)